MPELFPVQQLAVDKISAAFNAGKHKGFILADAMGIGKTAPAIEIAKQRGQALFICPAYLLYNWLDEFNLWGILPDTICTIDVKDQIIENKQFLIVAYSRITENIRHIPRRVTKKGRVIKAHDIKEPNNIVQQLLDRKFDLLVCDEGHYLKAWNSQRSRYILGTYQNKEKNFLYNAKNILLLTGTPILNRIEELYNIVIRIAPDVLDRMSKYDFYLRYAERIEHTGFGEIIAHGVRNEKELRKRLDPIFLRRTKIDGLKKLNEQTIKLDPRSPVLQKLFAQEEKFLAAHGIGLHNIEKLTKLTKIDVSEIAETRAKIALCKIPAMLELLQDIREEQETPAPVTIYCYHRITLNALRTAIEKKFPKLRAAFIDGGVDAKKRHEIITKQFQTGKLDVLCATIGALREGVNCTNGQDIIFIELDYVPANIAQAIGRFWRRGQKGLVNVRKLVFDAGIEKRILRVLAEKSNMIEKIYGGK